MSELTSLRNQVRRLKESLERHKRHIVAQDARNESLLRTVRELSLVKEPLDDVDMEEEDEDADVEDGEDWEDENSDEEDSEEKDLSLPIWDQTDLVYRCHQCSWEVLDGFCQGCDTEYNIPKEFSDPDQKAAAYYDNGTTFSASSSQDRRTSPRGDTPLPDNMLLHLEILPNEFGISRHEEYVQLRKRGAPIQMCHEFSLSFKPDTGIVTVLTPEIKQIFGGPDMQEEDTWELFLGRRVTLDEGDEDGSDFIIGLLEDALFYEQLPCISAGHPRDQWKTMKLVGRPNVWATRPTRKHICHEGFDGVAKDHDESDSEPEKDAAPEEVERWYNNPNNRLTAEDRALVTPFVERGPTRRQDEYEMTDVEDLETDDDGDPDVADPGYAFNPRFGHTNWSDGEDDGLYESEAGEPDEERDNDFESDEA